MASPPRSAQSSSQSLTSLRVHAGGHYLETADGGPFFWLADTAWQLMHALTSDEVCFYFAERARQGFTVVQVVALCETNGIQQPSAMGLSPFLDVASLTPNPAYFDHLRHVIQLAAEHRLYVALLPAWGDKLTAPWGDGPRLFENTNLDRVRRYARFVAELLHPYGNVVWMLGGDRPARLAGDPPDVALRAGFAPGDSWLPIWDAFASAIRKTDPQALLLYHPQGGEQSTSVLMRDVSWLDVNGMQSGHGAGHDVPVWNWIARDASLTPPKPTLDLEPNYEDHPVNPWPRWNPADGYFLDDDVRRQSYRSVFAGGCGVTYGHHAVWQFASEREEVINHANMDWRSALSRPGARQMIYLRELMLSRPYFDRKPLTDVVQPGQDRASHAVATGDSSGTYLMVYFPRRGQTLEVNLATLASGPLRSWWFNPQTGYARAAESRPSRPSFTATSPNDCLDAVLIVELEEPYRTAPGLGS